MKKNKLFLVFIILFSSFSILEAKVVNYDPKILNIPYSSWVAPFSYFKTALVQKQTDNFIRLDKGEMHGVKNGFIYSVLDTNKDYIGKITISVISDNYSEGYFNTNPQKVKEGCIAVFDGTVDLEENPYYAVCLEPEVKTTITLSENDLCYAVLPEKRDIVRAQQFIINDEKGEEAGLAEVMEVIPQGSSVFKINRKTKPIKAGFFLVSIQRSMGAWKNLGIELSKTPEYLQSALYAFYRTYEMDKKNATIAQEFEKQAKILIKEYEKNKLNYKALLISRQCQTITGGCKDEVKNFTSIVKSEALNYFETKNSLLAIKSLELLDRDSEIQNKLSISYNNEGASYPFDENSEYQIYLYQQAFEIENTNMLAAKNLLNLFLNFRNYTGASDHLKQMQKYFTGNEDKTWIDKKIEDVTRMQKGLIHDYKFKSINDKIIELSSLKGNVILLIQLSMKDPASLQVLDFIPAFYNQFKGKPFKLLAVNVDPRDRGYVNELKDFMKKYEPYDFDVVYSEENLKDLFKLSSLPENVLLDKDGKISFHEAGIINDDLEQIIKGLLK